MAKLTLTDLASLTNEASAIAAINANNAATEAALELTLSRNGATPNTMSANLDMNSFRILNLAAPVDDNDPVRLVDVVDGITGPTGPQGPAGAALADGDAGDIVVSGSGTILTLDPTVVTTFAKSMLDDANAAAVRTTLGLAGAAVLAVGTSTGTVAAGDDSRFTTYTITAKNATGNMALNENFVYHSSASTHTFTIQPVATVAIPQGYPIVIKAGVSSGAVTLARGAGVALYINGSTTSADGTIAAGATITILQYDTNTWLAQGNGIS